MLLELFQSWNLFDYKDPFSLNSGFFVLFVLIILLALSIKSSYKELINTKYFRVFPAEYTLEAVLFIVTNICIIVVVFNTNIYSLLLTTCMGWLWILYSYKVLCLKSECNVGQLLRIN